MAEEPPTEEGLDRRLRYMGPELGSVFDALSNDLFRLQRKWNQYRQLYARSSKRIELLNQTAGHFFGLIQEIMLEDIVLHLARLSDKEKIGKRENLSLQRLPALILDEQLSIAVAALVKDALIACDFTRAWRNRRLAHRDLALSLASSVDPLPGFSRADIEEALASIRNLLNRVSTYYMGCETDYKVVIAYGRDADSLVDYLRLGLGAEEKRLERLEKGEFLPEDFERQIEI